MQNNDTIIIVEGMGGLINYEMFIIEEALKAAGIKVIVINESPEKNELDTISAMHQHYANNPNTKIVKLIAKHYPWGG